MLPIKIEENNNNIIIIDNEKQIQIESILSKTETINLLKKYIKEQTSIILNNTDIKELKTNENYSCLYFINNDDEIILTFDFKNKQILNNKDIQATQTYIYQINFSLLKDFNSEIEWINNFIKLLQGNYVYSPERECSINTYFKQLCKDINNILILEFLSKQGFNQKYNYQFRTFIQEILLPKIKNNEKFKMHKLLGITEYQYNLCKQANIINHTDFLDCNNFFNSNHKLYIEYLLNRGYIRSFSFLKYYKVLSEKIITANYDLYRLIDYINIDCDYQGIESKKEAIQLLFDYVKMNIDMEIYNFEKYPKYLKTYHDIILKNYKVKLDEIKNNKYEKIKLNNSNKQFKNKEYEVILPENLEEIVKEGSILHHCVASYIDKVLNEKSMICFMRYKDKLKESLITLEIIDNKIIHAKGTSNRNPTLNESEFLKQYQEYLDNL